MNPPEIEDWFDADHQVEQCESCPHPNGCIRQCIIEEHQNENVAKIRNEEVN
jgi:hypothetical protein